MVNLRRILGREKEEEITDIYEFKKCEIVEAIKSVHKDIEFEEEIKEKYKDLSDDELDRVQEKLDIKKGKRRTLILSGSVLVLAGMFALINVFFKLLLALQMTGDFGLVFALLLAGVVIPTCIVSYGYNLLNKGAEGTGIKI